MTDGEVEPQVCLVGLGLRPRAIEHQQVLGCKRKGRCVLGGTGLGRVDRAAMPA